MLQAALKTGDTMIHAGTHVCVHKEFAATAFQFNQDFRCLAFYSNLGIFWSKVLANPHVQTDGRENGTDRQTDQSELAYYVRMNFDEPIVN